MDTWLAVPVVAAAALFAVEALLSLGWGIEHDTPPMAYAGFLIGRHGVMPYRDLFDPNLPGTYFCFAVLDRLFGANEFAFRCADLVLLASLCGLTWAWLRPFGWKAALAGPTLFGLYYLHDGPTLCLQREFIMLPLLSLAVLLATGLPRLGSRPRALGIGAALGLAALIKPQALVLVPACLAFLLVRPPAGGDAAPSAAARRGRWLRDVAWCAAGVGVPLIATAVWLAANGALVPYLRMARDYYPLYAHLSGVHETLGELERRRSVLHGWWLLGGMRWWLLPAALGAVAATGLGRSPAQRRVVGLLVVLALLASLFPMMAGQFFPYHWIPFFFFLAALSGLCLADPAPGSPRWLRATAGAALLAVAVTHTTIAAEVSQRLAGRPYQRHLGGRVDAIAAYLRRHVGPGDTVQPLDWTGGAVDAMWRARAPLATRFMADFYFYHHVSSPVIQSLRREFLAELRRARPRVVIEVLTLKPWVSGTDTTREFPELDLFLQEHYVPDVAGDGYVLYLRRDGA